MSPLALTEEEGQAVSFEERMRRLERRANVARSRLLRAVEALDTRRHQIADIGKRAKRLAVPVALAALGAVALFAGALFAAGQALRARRGRSLPGRLSTALRALDRPRPPSLARRILDRVTLAIVSILATEIAKRTTKDVLDGRSPEGRLRRLGGALARGPS